MKIPDQTIKKLLEQFALKQEANEELIKLLQIQDTRQFFKQLTMINFRQIESFSNIQQFSEIFNRFDQLLEQETLKLEKHLGQAKIQQIQEFNQIQANLIEILTALQKLLEKQSHNYLFYSVDRLVKLMKISFNYKIIYYCLYCAQEYFRDLRSASQFQYQPECKYSNEMIQRLFYYTYFYSEHQNLFNPKHVEFSDYFHDDPNYDLDQQESMTRKRKSKRKFSLQVNEQNNFETDSFNFFAQNFDAVKELGIDSSLNINLEVKNFKLKYKKLNPLEATKQIVKTYRLPIQEDTIIFDALMFRVKILKLFESYEQRKFIFLSCMMSNVLQSNLVILINTAYFKNAKKCLREWSQILPSAIEFQQELKNAMKLFYFQLDPEVHKAIILCCTRLISLDENETEFKAIIIEVTKQYSLIDKLLKDCTSIEFQVQQQDQENSNQMDIENKQQSVKIRSQPVILV